MRFTVAVTRPEPQASETASQLARRGYQVVRAPVLRAEPLDGWGTADGIGTLAMTSRTAAAMLADHPAFRTIPIFCVGAASARAARAAGARSVRNSEGDVEALFDLLCREARPPVVHLAGEDQRGDLVGALRGAGIAAERRIVYRMVAAESLPAQPGPLDATLLYSPRSAAIYTRLATRPPWREAPCVALSEAVAANAPPGVATTTAHTPDEPALLAALDALRVSHA